MGLVLVGSAWARDVNGGQKSQAWHWSSERTSLLAAVLSRPQVTAGQATSEGKSGRQGVIDDLVQEGFATDSAVVQSAHSDLTTGVKQVLEGLPGMTTYLHAVQTSCDAGSRLASALERQRENGSPVTGRCGSAGAGADGAPG